MMIVAEGDEEGGAEILNGELQKANCPFPTRVVILGHLQRGGTPTPDDRILASELGAWAAQAVFEGHTGVMAGRIGGRRELTRFEDTYASHKPIPTELLELLRVLAK
jgi:6-phosphofructokinase 1